MLDAFKGLLSSKLCWYNRPGPNVRYTPAKSFVVWLQWDRMTYQMTLITCNVLYMREYLILPVMLNASKYLLCSKLCYHMTGPKPKADSKPLGHYSLKRYIIN